MNSYWKQNEAGNAERDTAGSDEEKTSEETAPPTELDVNEFPEISRSLNRGAPTRPRMPGASSWTSVQRSQRNTVRATTASTRRAQAPGASSSPSARSGSEDGEGSGLCLLQGVELDGEIHQLRDGGYERVTSYVDSGAITSVIPSATAAQFPVRESAGSRRGQQFAVANGARLPNLGERTVRGLSDAFGEVQMTYQVAEVTKPLNSVGQMCDAGSWVLFHRDGGVIVSEKTGAETHFNREDGMYVLHTWVKQGHSSSRVQIHRSSAGF